jgi:hypothetical protein
MNLVKAQEYAQSLPVAELKKYADGLNPSMIPPWLATGEMQAKTKRAEMANNLQGAAQGQQPSVKEQVEQKAGLLGLQQAQQQATQQQMMQARPMAGPVPTGTPQPEAQPRPTQMAGLNQLQSNIKMAGGGIVAFAAGDKVKAGPEFIKFLQSMGIDYTDFAKSSVAAQDNIKDMFRAAQGSQPAAQAAPAAAQTVQGNASPKAFQVGQKARPMLEAAGQSIKGKAIPVVGAGLSAYEGLSGINDAKEFYDDSNVPTTEKAKQFLRTAGKTALPYIGGAVGSGIAPVAGTIGGTAAGAGLAALIDQEGDALKKYRAAQAAGQVSNQSAAETARLKATTPASDMGTEGRRTGQVAMGNGINVSPNLIPASARPTPPAVPQNVNPNATKVNPNAPAAPAAPAPDSMEAMFRTSLENKPKERKVEDLIAEDQDIKKRLGLDEPAGKAKLERIAEMNKQYAATQLSPMDELIAMLGQSGQYKGLSGLAPAYTGMAEKKRAADAAQAKLINDLMGGVEDTQRGEKTASATGVRTAREKDVGDVRSFDREKMQSLGSARGQDIQAASAKYNADMSYKSAMAQMANANARQDVQEKRLLLDSFKTRIASIDKELVPLEKSFLKKDKELAEQLRGEKAGLTKALDETSGIGKMTGAPSAASPSGTSKPGWGIKPI